MYGSLLDLGREGKSMGRNKEVSPLTSLNLKITTGNMWEVELSMARVREIVVVVLLNQRMGLELNGCSCKLL